MKHLSYNEFTKLMKDRGETAVVTDISAMRDCTELTKFCEFVENIFTSYHLEYNYDRNGEITSVLIRATYDIFSDTFLRIMFDNLKDYTIYFRCDFSNRPIVKIVVE